MLIIKPYDTQKPDKRFICPFCGCEFVAEKREYDEFTSHSCDRHIHVQCPNCRAVVDCVKKL